MAFGTQKTEDRRVLQDQSPALGIKMHSPTAHEMCGHISFSNSKPKKGYSHRGIVQISTNLRCAIIDVIFVVSIIDPYAFSTATLFSVDNSETEIDLSMPKLIAKKFTRRKQRRTTKTSFRALDLRNDECLALVKTKTKTHARNA